MTPLVCHVPEPLEALPIGPKLYPVAQLGPLALVIYKDEIALLAKSAGVPIEGDYRRAYVRIVKALVDGHFPELTDDYVALWLSQGLCNAAALEMLRQTVAPIPMARA